MKDLTERQKKIVELVQHRALLNKEIAHEVGMKENGVKAELFVIFKKLKVKNRTELAMIGLIPSPSPLRESQ